MNRHFITDYYYSDGREIINIARIVFDGNRISFDICPECKKRKIPNFKPGAAKQHVQHMIRLPLLRSELRSKTLPYFFKAIEPNSLEHFQCIPHDTTYFKFSPIQEKKKTVFHGRMVV